MAQATIKSEWAMHASIGSNSDRIARFEYKYEERTNEHAFSLRDEVWDFVCKIEGLKNLKIEWERGFPEDALILSFFAPEESINKLYESLEKHLHSGKFEGLIGRKIFQKPIIHKYSFQTLEFNRAYLSEVAKKTGLKKQKVLGDILEILIKAQCTPAGFVTPNTPEQFAKKVLAGKKRIPVEPTPAREKKIEKAFNRLFSKAPYSNLDFIPEFEKAEPIFSVDPFVCP